MPLPRPQKALGEFPDKEVQLQQMEVQGQGVLDRTSEEGRVHIVRDMKRLRESWVSLYNTSLNLHRYLGGERGCGALVDRIIHLSCLCFRLLHSSTDHMEPDSWQVRGRSVGEGGSHVTAEGSGQRTEQVTGLYGTSGDPEATAGEDGWMQGHDGGHFIPAGREDEHLSLSRTGGGSGLSLAGEEVDSSAWSVFNRAGESRTVVSPDCEKPSGGGGSILTAAGQGTALTTKVSYHGGGTVSSGEGVMEAAENLGQGGGGAFIPFRRDTAKLPSTTSTQDTLVRGGMFNLHEGSQSKELGGYNMSVPDYFLVQSTKQLHHWTSFTISLLHTGPAGARPYMGIGRAFNSN